MLDAQLHAIALIRSVYPVPNLPQFSSIPDWELTEQEMNMSDAERESAARILVLGSVYGLNKQAVSQNVNACVSVLQEEANRQSGEMGRRLSLLRTAMWIVTLTIILILTATFLALFFQVFKPLRGFVRKLRTGGTLDETRGFREVRMVAAAYNGAAKRRAALDNILRTAAETDALTNLRPTAIALSSTSWRRRSAATAWPWCSST